MFGIFCLLAIAAPRSGWASSAAIPAACEGLQAKYLTLKGKTLVDIINPHIPGYEVLDPNDPSQSVGFDIDLAETLGKWLGFGLTYKPVTFAAMLPTLQSGQGDLVISDSYGPVAFCVVPSSVNRQHSSAEEFCAGLSVHGTLECLRPVDLSFCLSVTPFFADGVPYGVQVPAKNLREPVDRIEP